MGRHACNIFGRLAIELKINYQYDTLLINKNVGKYKNGYLQGKKNMEKTNEIVLFETQDKDYW